MDTGQKRDKKTSLDFQLDWGKKKTLELNAS